MKTCIIDGCSSPQFGGGFCKYHGYMRRMKGGDLYKPKSRLKSPIPKESKTRKKERLRYTEVCERLTQEIKDANNGKIYCFFSGLEITGKPTFHHLKGRIGDYYVDKEWLVPAINEYHLAYHFTPIEKLMEEFWYLNFLAKLKLKDTQLYYKELKKQEKAELF